MLLCLTDSSPSMQLLQQLVSISAPIDRSVDNYTPPSAQLQRSLQAPSESSPSHTPDRPLVHCASPSPEIPIYLRSSSMLPSSPQSQGLCDFPPRSAATSPITSTISPPLSSMDHAPRSYLQKKIGGLYLLSNWLDRQQHFNKECPQQEPQYGQFWVQWRRRVPLTQRPKASGTAIRIHRYA
jgi:hypothetical protein